jgi:hypothetical protein
LDQQPLISGDYQDVEEGNVRSAHLRNFRPDDLRGLCGGSIQTFRTLSGGLGEQKDL